tara:strand:- start:940 stop:1080 length:141 start_codon:yes stop_codon:yes gene_type:complete
LRVSEIFADLQEVKERLEGNFRLFLCLVKKQNGDVKRCGKSTSLSR